MRRALLTLTAVSLAALAAPAIAQVIPVDSRLDRLEKELRAVQRKVFPAGAPVQPDVTASVVPSTAVPSSTPVTDLLSRVDALERQLATLTGQVEQSNFKLRQLEDNFTRYKAEVDARLGPATPALTANMPETSDMVVAQGARPAAVAAAPKPAPAASKPATATVATTAKAPAQPAVTPAASEARTKAVAAIERPDTGNSADDGYTYGYRLWAAKYYPEAQIQLKDTLEKYGSTPLASRTANLLGRAYLDDGQTERALLTFYDNYQKRPRGDRAAQSLAYMGEALIRMKRLPDACKVYKELQDGYGETLDGELRAMMDKGRGRAKCTA